MKKVAYTKITDNIWLGNICGSRDIDFYNENNITVTINCTASLDFAIDVPIKERLSVRDDLTRFSMKKMYNSLDNIVTKIDYYTKYKKNIFVHCYAGKQRSACVLAAYLMKYHHMSRKKAVHEIKSKRRIAFTPGINFQCVLRLYELKLNSIRTK